MRVLATLSILASSVLFTQPASAIGTLYSPSTGNGDVACTVYGSFTIQNNVIIRSDEYCYGEVIIPSGVTAIADGAFGRKNLSSISIPNTVTRIGEGAFQFSELVSITIPDSVTSIGPGLFYNAHKLTTVILGNGITEIPDRAFEHTHGLTSVNIPNSVLSIGYGAFWAAISLTSITIPDSVTSIGRSAFQSMLALQSVVIGNGVTTINNLAFSYLPSLTNLVIGNSVWYIGTYTFAGPNQLTSVTLPSSLSTLGTNAFSERENSSSANVNLLSYKYCGTGVDASALSNAGLGSKTRLACPAAITAGSEPDSKVATFSSGVTLAEIPVSSALPAIKLAFTGTAPSSLIVKPISNPASLSATPFMTTNSPKIVDIVITGGHDGSDVKVCLDGASSDNLYHYTGGQWVELPGRTYENNQVCGITNSFSPFVAAQTNPVVAPGAPIIGTATATGTTTATVDFTAPASDGGSTIISYTATSTPGSITATLSQAGSGTIPITGLSPSTSYTFMVTALNSSGASLASSASNSISTVGVPSAPTSIAATTTGKRSALVTLTNSASNGGSNVTSYTITASPGGLSKTFTVGSPTTLAYEFLNLEPATSYTFTVTATNAIGTSSATTSNSIKTDSLVPASLSAISFTDDGTGTAGKITWSGKNIDAVLYTGPANSYPGPFNFGAFSTSWNGTIRNLTPETEYTFSIFAISSDGVGESKSLTFKTGSGVPGGSGVAMAQSSSKLTQIISWVNQNSFVPGEAANINSLLTKFDALVTSAHRSYLKVPTSRVSKVEVKSLTPKACSVVSATAKVDAGLVTAHTKDTCTISYTVSGASRAWATFVKDFTFKKVSK